MPERLRKYAAAIPAGPPPMTAAFPLFVIGEAVILSMSASYPFSAAISFIPRM